MLSHSLRIRLDGGNDQVLHPGQTVTGTVVYKAPAGERLVALNIDFRGVTKIMPKKGATHIETEYIELFHMGEKLLRNPILIQHDEKYSWDFSFVLPRVTGPDRSQGMYLDTGNSLFDEHKHVLPPSIEPSSTPETKVEYNLYAVAKEQAQGQGIRLSENFHARPVVDVLDHLKLAPDLEEIPVAEPHVYEKVFATTEQPPKRRFSMVPGRDSMGRGSISRTNSLAVSIRPFTLVAKAPSFIVPGEGIDVELSIRPPDDSQPPATYTHKITTISVDSITHRRTTKTRYNPSLDIISTTKFDPKKASRALPLEPAAPLTHRFSTDSLKSLPPSFKSYSLAREYQLRLATVIIFEKQEYEAVWNVPVQLIRLASGEQVTSRRISNAPPPPPPIPEHWHRRFGVDDELPPAYEPRR